MTLLEQIDAVTGDANNWPDIGSAMNLLERCRNSVAVVEAIERLCPNGAAMSIDRESSGEWYVGAGLKHEHHAPILLAALEQAEAEGVRPAFKCRECGHLCEILKERIHYPFCPNCAHPRGPAPGRADPCQYDDTDGWCNNKGDNNE
jgi:hypothetical protein